MDEMARCRREETVWPRVSLLWEQHPLVQWVNDRLITAFGRNQAPIIAVSSIDHDADLLFLISGLIPNRKGQSVVEDWFAIAFHDNTAVATLSLEEVIRCSGLDASSLPNPGSKEQASIDTQLVSEALELARLHLQNLREDFVERTNPRLIEYYKRLNELKKRQLEFARAAERSRSRLEQRQNSIDRMFSDYKQWIEDTLRLGPEPYLRIAAVIREEE